MTNDIVIILLQLMLPQLVFTNPNPNPNHQKQLSFDTVSSWLFFLFSFLGTAELHNSPLDYRSKNKSSLHVFLSVGLPTHECVCPQGDVIWYLQGTHLTPNLNAVDEAMLVVDQLHQGDW